jgi:hypothetical protein
MKFNRFLFAFLASAFLFFAGCDSNVMDEDPAAVSLKVQPVFDGQQLIAGQTYDHNGTAISFSTARTYLSEIVLIAEDGTETSFTGESISVPAKDELNEDYVLEVADRIILAKHDLGEDQWDLGEAKPGAYKGIRFKVGIDSPNNNVDASQVPASHALAKQTDKNNHWNWANGYIYLRLDGLVDSDGDGTPDEVWETHIGKTNFLREVQLDTSFELMADEGNIVHIILDYHELLQTVDLSDPAQRLSHTGDNLPVANKVANMVGNAFEFHGLHMAEGHDH